MSVAAPIWFLDIDGVVNALEPRAGLVATSAETAGRRWPIHYSPEVVAFVNTCHRSGLVEVRWLTTWEQDAHRSLAPTVGLDDFPSYDIPDEDSRSGWWKADIVTRVASEEGRPFIWTDDDLAAEQPDLPPGLGDHLTLAPDPLLGLTRSDLDVVLGFLEGMHVRAEVADAPAPSTENDWSEWIDLFPNYLGWTDDEVVRILEASPPTRLDDLLIIAEEAMFEDLDLDYSASYDEVQEAIRRHSEHREGGSPAGSARDSS